MIIVCDNAYHDRGNGVCSFCAQKRIDEAVKAERERCTSIIEAVIADVRRTMPGMDYHLVVALLKVRKSSVPVA